VVGGEGDQWDAELRGVRGAADVHRGRALWIRLRTVHVGPRRSVEDKLPSPLGQRVTERKGHVPVLVPEREHVVVGEDVLQRAPELAARAGDQDATTVSRADRIGVRVLHRCATRGSFQGTVCSSGSRWSYSAVTW